MARIKLPDGTTYTEDKTVDGDLFAVIVGDEKQPSKFEQQVKIERWGNDANFSARLVDPFPLNGATTIEEAEKLAYVSTNYECHFYESTDGLGYEFDVVLKARPASNVLNFTVESKNLVAYFQPALTPAELLDGVVRPPNIVGSYAFYHVSEANNGYRAGKAFHLNRPLITDARKLSVWGDLAVDLAAGTMSVTIPSVWLAAAKYPVTIDPDFGYKTAGATTSNTNNDLASFRFKQAPESGNVTSLHMYTILNSGSKDVKTVLWGPDPYAVLRVGPGHSIVNTTAAWIQKDVTAVAVTASTEYAIGAVSGSGAGTAASFFYDTGITGDGGHDGGNSHSSPVAITTPFGSTDRLYSFFARVPAVLAASVSAPITVSGALSVPKPLAASVSTSVTVSADLSVGAAGAALAASVSAPITVSGALSVPKPLAASVSSSVAVTGALSVPKPLAASVSSSVAVTGALDVPKPVAASVTTAVTVSGALDVPKPLAASVSLPVTTTADLTAPAAGAALAASVSISAAVSAGLDVPKPLAASVSVPVTVLGNITQGHMTASATTSISVSGALDVPKPLAASVSVPVTTSAALTVAHDLAASVSAPITATADLTAGIALASSVSVPITVSADLLVPKPLAAGVSSAITVSADLTAPGASAALASTVSLPLTVVGALDVPKPMTATVSLPVTTSANLTAPSSGVDLNAVVSVTVSTEGLLFLPSTLVVEDRDLLWLSAARQAKSISTNRDISQI